jgi:hypothetical protein
VLEGMKLPDGGFIARPADEEEEAFIDRVVALHSRPGCVVRMITQRTPPPGAPIPYCGSSNSGDIPEGEAVALFNAAK